MPILTVHGVALWIAPFASHRTGRWGRCANTGTTEASPTRCGENAQWQADLTIRREACVWIRKPVGIPMGILIPIRWDGTTV
jgi:hypothetical protein